MKSKMIGSAPNLEILSKKMNEYFFQEVRLIQVDEKTYHVHNSRSRIDGFVVKVKNSRFRLEMECS